MILVDTSIWIDHLHACEPLLVALLRDDQVGCHRAVIEELALGSMKQRDRVLAFLGNLQRFPVLTHEEVMALVEGRHLWGRGLSAVDARQALAREVAGTAESRTSKSLEARRIGPRTDVSVPDPRWSL